MPYLTKDLSSDLDVVEDWHHEFSEYFNHITDNLHFGYELYPDAIGSRKENRLSLVTHSMELVCAKHHPKADSDIFHDAFELLLKVANWSGETKSFSLDGLTLQEGFEKIIDVLDEPIKMPEEILRKAEKSLRRAMILGQVISYEILSRATDKPQQKTDVKSGKRGKYKLLPKGLSPKQIQALELYNHHNGDYKMIAGKMNLSERTVREHVKLGMQKLGMKINRGRKVKTQNMPEDVGGQTIIDNQKQLRLSNKRR